MIFEGLDNWDQYSYRADVTNTDNDDVDDCEGTGLGGSGKYTGQLNAGKTARLQSPARSTPFARPTHIY